MLMPKLPDIDHKDSNSSLRSERLGIVKLQRVSGAAVRVESTKRGGIGAIVVVTNTQIGCLDLCGCWSIVVDLPAGVA